VLADWIGSAQQWFPYTSPDLSLADYWRTHAVPNAGLAVEQAGVLPVSSAGAQSFEALTGIAGFAPSPMQQWAETVGLPAGPTLHIIEDATGSGKTEAALMLAHRLMAAGRADELYVALPTMATSDAMYARLAGVYRSPTGSPLSPLRMAPASCTQASHRPSSMWV
jgi:CRISPR-associated endonuclease/helicase Cas3